MMPKVERRVERSCPRFYAVVRGSAKWNVQGTFHARAYSDSRRRTNDAGRTKPESEGRGEQ
jgi:hypothetical protein